MNNLDAFTRSYIDAALWSSTDEDRNGEPLDDNYDPSDIAPEAMAVMVSDCEQFQETNSHLFVGAYRDESEYSDWERAGHDFWLTRNRHGVGFWDRDMDKAISKDLTDAAHAFGEQHLYVGDDEKIYVC